MLKRNLVVLVAFAVVIIAACRSGHNLPDKSSKEYRDVIKAFYVGLAAMQTGEDTRAEENLSLVTQLAPGEPAGWANLGLLALRQREFDRAAERLEEARALGPEQSQIHVLLGLLESTRGRYDEAISYLRRAIALDPKDLKAIYALAQEVERQGDEQGQAEAQGLIKKILEAQPDNLAAQLELIRIAAKRGDADTLQSEVARLGTRAASWPAEAKDQFSALQSAASDNPRLAATRVAFLKNVLVRDADYRQGLAAVKCPPEIVGEPIEQLLVLPSPVASPAPPDDSMTFAVERLSQLGDTTWQWAGAMQLSGESLPTLIKASGSEVQVSEKTTLAFPGGKSKTPPGPGGILGLDFNYDFKVDLFFAGAGGLRLFQQESATVFTDVTARMLLPAAITAAAYKSAWAADIDLEGDLDIVVAPSEGLPFVLSNNGDGTFNQARPFEALSSLVDFTWADIDGDGDPDAAMLDNQGKLRLYFNERSGQFRPRPLLEVSARLTAIAAADTNSDGLLDVIALESDGKILRLSVKSEKGDLERAQLVDRAHYPPDGIGEPAHRLFAADLDNNGALDLIDTSYLGTHIWIADAKGGFQPDASSSQARIFSIVDTSGDGRLDLVGQTAAGEPMRLINRSAKNYHWQVIRPRAASSEGDQRINSFGIGGEMEIRAGMLFQKQLISGPAVHFGLGEYEQADLVRIIWPNGSVQAEYDLPSDKAVMTEQRLKGSCPWLFTYDGEKMQFVTDFIWRSPLGLRINAQDTASVMMTEDWVKIRGDQMKARDGFYDLRITTELWETQFFDHVSLMVVDHPAGTEVFVDERFAFPPPALAIYPTAPPRPVSRAWDDRGRDVTDVVRSRDERYLDTFGRGSYQGVTRDHYVEVELGEEAPEARPLWLIASGWIHPTDSSINVALSQGRHAPPQGLSLEVADGKGGWEIAKAGLGFPAGKTKTILINLDGVFRPAAPRRLRLRTNMEIFWDALEVAAALPATEVRTQRLNADTVELRYRGFSRVRQADASSPELPDYNKLAGTAQIWRDLIGYHTRYGDVRELLVKVDDRYVIMNAGDEMAFSFAAPNEPPEGWVRDFVLIGDGWVKDGDFNTRFSKTVLPLPSHDRPDYTNAPGRLEDDPVYARHSSDWQQYHTRYITPERFQNALRPGNGSR